MKYNYITTPEKARVEVEGTRRYQWGEKLPSVTTILSAVPDQGKAIALARWRERVGEEEAEKIKMMLLYGVQLCIGFLKVR